MSETEIEVLVRVDGELLPLGVEPLADGVPECWVRALVAALRAVADHVTAWALWDDEGEGAA